MKIVLFGSNGMLGKYISSYFSNKYKVINLSRKELDISKSNEKEIFGFLDSLVDENDIIINAAGVIKQRDFDINEMILVNSLFPNILAKYKLNKKCQVIHITTDCVFSGAKGNYFEYDLHDCTDEYGKSKSLGENKNLTIIRTSIIGEELYNKKSLLEWIKSNKEGNIFGYTNHYWNGITCLELAKLIEKIIVSGDYWMGVRHLFSPNKVSKYQLLKFINKIYDLKINITPKKDKKKIKRDLNSQFINYISTNIKEQIKELKNFKIC